MEMNDDLDWMDDDDADEDDWPDDCHMGPDGQCGAAGSEECEFCCPVMADWRRRPWDANGYFDEQAAPPPPRTPQMQPKKLSAEELAMTDAAEIARGLDPYRRECVLALAHKTAPLVFFDFAEEVRLRTHGYAARFPDVSGRVKLAGDPLFEFYPADNDLIGLTPLGRAVAHELEKP